MSDDTIRLGLLCIAGLLLLVLVATWPRKREGLPPPCRSVNRNKCNDYYDYLTRMWRES